MLKERWIRHLGLTNTSLRISFGSCSLQLPPKKSTQKYTKDEKAITVTLFIFYTGSLINLTHHHGSRTFSLILTIDRIIILPHGENSQSSEGSLESPQRRSLSLARVQSALIAACRELGRAQAPLKQALLNSRVTA